MHENRDVVQYTHVVCAHPVFLGRTTLLCVLIFMLLPVLQPMEVQEKKCLTLEEVEVEFGNMVVDILQAFNSCNVDVHDFLIKLRSASAVREREVPLFGAGIFDKVTSIDKLFEILSEYWHVFDYDVLEYLVNTAQCETAKQRYSNYLEAYSKYLRSIDLATISNSQLVLRCSKLKSENLLESTCRVRRLCSRIRRFCNRIRRACTSIRRLSNRIRRLCNGIRRICFRISRVCTGIRYGYNDSKKLATCHEVNNFCHGGCHLRQKKATEASFTCHLAS